LTGVSEEVEVSHILCGHRTGNPSCPSRRFLPAATTSRTVALPSARYMFTVIERRQPVHGIHLYGPPPQHSYRLFGLYDKGLLVHPKALHIAGNQARTSLTRSSASRISQALYRCWTASSSLFASSAAEASDPLRIAVRNSRLSCVRSVSAGVPPGQRNPRAPSEMR